jgi:hypothetical protein
MHTVKLGVMGFAIAFEFSGTPPGLRADASDRVAF